MKKQLMWGVVAAMVGLFATPVFAATIQVSGRIMRSTSNLTLTAFVDSQSNQVPASAVTITPDPTNASVKRYTISASVPTGTHTIAVNASDSGQSATKVVTITVAGTTTPLSLTIDSPVDQSTCDANGTCIGPGPVSCRPGIDPGCSGNGCPPGGIPGVTPGC